MVLAVEYIAGDRGSHIIDQLRHAGYATADVDPDGGCWFPRWVTTLRRCCVGTWTSSKLRHVTQEERSDALVALLRDMRVNHSAKLNAAYRLGGPDALRSVFREVWHGGSR